MIPAGTLADISAENLVKIRKNTPLIHNTTNYAVMNFTANALLAMGASPVMAHAENKVEEMELQWLQPMTRKMPQNPAFKGPLDNGSLTI